jgi:hypothetical protein
MLRIVGSLLLSAIMLQGCADLGPASNTHETQEPGLVSGKFVVDEFAAACSVKVMQGDGSVRAYIPLTVRYHFEGSPGSIGKVIVSPTGYMATNLNISPVGPDSIGTSRLFANSFRVSSTLEGVDSIVVHCAVGGAYWNGTSGEARPIGTFDWSTDKRIAVSR